MDSACSFAAGLNKAEAPGVRIVGLAATDKLVVEVCLQHWGQMTTGSEAGAWVAPDL